MTGQSGSRCAQTGRLGNPCHRVPHSQGCWGHQDQEGLRVQRVAHQSRHQSLRPAKSLDFPPTAHARSVAARDPLQESSHLPHPDLQEQPVKQASRVILEVGKSRQPPYAMHGATAVALTSLQQQAKAHQSQSPPCSANRGSSGADVMGTCIAK